MTTSIQKNRRISQEKIDKGEFDVFISYNRQDQARVMEIGELLKDNGIAPFLDEWNQQPGLPWQSDLEKQITTVKSAAIFVGEAGIGSWHRKEMYEFELEFEKRGLPVIPVLLPDISSTRDLPLFLKSMNWVDFRRTDHDPLERLIWGITGKRGGK
jgi:hypothetical protein